MKFIKLAETFEEIEATTKRLQMTSLLVELIKATPKDQLGKVLNLLQGRLYPDYMGIELGVAEKLLTKAIAEVTGKPEPFVESVYKKTGDLGSSVEQLLRKKSQSTLSQKPLTVNTVYETFEKIAHSSGPGSIEKKIRHLISLLSDASPLESKFIARIAIGNLRLGVADMTMLDALAIAYGGGKEARQPLERAYNLSSDLSYVADVVAQDGLKGINEFKISVGRPIRSMLCERLPSAKEILEKLGGEAAAEYKYDGLRAQAHIGPNSVQLFSRRLENITDQFPDVAENLRESVKVNEAIVEGECVAVDPQTGDMLPFQVISQRRGRKFDIEKMSEEVPITLFLFDLLYVQGRDMTNMPYPERRKTLSQITTNSDHVKISAQFMVNDSDRIDELMNQAVASGCEGLVIKNISKESIYQAGARGWLWIKYKRSYKAEVQDTVDLVPVGAFAGRGRRAGGYGALLMAAYNSKEDTFETLCKLGSGFTDEDIANLPKTMMPYVISKEHPRVSSLMTPDVWFLPAIVLEVAADEITLSPLHTCSRGAIRPNSGLALRFPRFTGNWRKDKSAEDATSSQEALEMYQRQLKKIGSN
ncbi:MAG TPA: ATP-dependent DNA ligase [Candidatus Bathyarchaeia archaeon]|nr:ATP-dependent DNA ligase [Candidatus Bathyarchaeia archaeon]